ncbi:hypothetical protein SAMN05443245_6704 [Paraburkholderia fungorum]|uniref:Uncharacterized protein n=1 Tax=Paraburkholderia fungorum TaxID=134537 RepID=A0A1H1JKN6_9BURK|nr:hypothetical protein SAMN05443245_6704 [Paraburkholderia fungorum]
MNWKNRTSGSFRQARGAQQSATPACKKQMNFCEATLRCFASGKTYLTVCN